MKKLLAILCLLCLTMGLAGCNTQDSTNGVFQTPDFAEPPIAAGTSIVTNIETMLSRVNGLQTIHFSFAETLANAKQTFYDNSSATTGVVLENNVTPFNEIVVHLDLIDFTDLLPLKAEEFELGDNGKMAYLHNEAFSKVYQNGVLTDFCFDLTTKTLIIRVINIASDDTSSSTTYITIEIYMGAKDAYNTSVRMEEYGNKNGTEFIVISNSTLSFTTKDGELTSGVFEQIQDTSISEQIITTTSNGSYVEEKLSAERATINTQIRVIDGRYDVMRTNTVYQAENTQYPDEAQEVYRATQSLQWVNNQYKLTEAAEGVGTDGQALKTEQYVVFEEKEAKTS